MRSRLMITQNEAVEKDKSASFGLTEKAGLWYSISTSFCRSIFLCANRHRSNEREAYKPLYGGAEE